MMGVILIPWVAIAVPEYSKSVETLHRDVKTALGKFEESLLLRERHQIHRVPWRDRLSLTPNLREKYIRWHQLLEEEKKWKKALELKEVLLTLYPDESDRTDVVRSEADRISYEVIQVMYRYRKEWKMLNLALFHNMLINMKIKDKGFCWHWVEKYLETLRPIGFKHFDLHWGVAYEANLRENNALIITRHGAPFESGLAIDSWRSSGRPFWRLVKKDRFPWVKRDESQLASGEFH